jgi:mono/diheme cytochrome c family protein
LNVKVRNSLWIATWLLSACLPSLGGAETSAERGKYLTTAGNCGACHTAPGGKLMAGGLAFQTPFGTIHSTNITSDAQTGIGKWTVAQFQQALRQGIDADGSHLYPVFPYTSFTNVTNEDAASIFAYLKTLPAVRQAELPNEMSFPYNQRWLLTAWNTLFFTAGPYKPDPARSAEWNRGAYLVEGLEHCSACHSPRNSLGAERTSQALTGGVYKDKVSADSVRTWSAPNLTGAGNGLASWSVEALAAYLKTGQNSAAATFGPMNEVIMNSTQYLTDADLHAMATYLKSLPANPGDVGAAASEEVTTAGSAVYDVHCGTCHQPSGMGADDSGPPLAGSPIVQAGDPASLLNIIIYGPQLPQPAPPVGNWKKMDPYGDKLSDDEIAQLSSYLRGAWGNKGGEVTAAQVAKQR